MTQAFGAAFSVVRLKPSGSALRSVYVRVHRGNEGQLDANLSRRRLARSHRHKHEIRSRQGQNRREANRNEHQVSCSTA
eukprot:2236293-Pleurochrysis_carterae.AAC.2